MNDNTSALRGLDQTDDLSCQSEFYKILIDSIPVPIFYKNAQGKYSGCNQAFENMLGKRKDEIIGKTVYELSPSNLAKIYNDNDIELMQKGGRQIYESSVVYADGSYQDVIFHKAVFKNSNGTLGGLVGVIIDITEQKKIEADYKKALEENKLKQRETTSLLKASRYIPLFDTFKDAAHMVFDICIELIGAKSGYIALLSEDGTENEVLFLESGGLPCYVDPELPMPIRGLREVAYRTKKAVYDNDFNNSQWMEFMPSGHVKLRNVLFVPLVIKEQVVGLMGIANKPEGFTESDVRLADAFGDMASVALKYAKYKDELRENEEKYRSMMESMVDAIYISSSDFRVEYMNPSMIKRIGSDNNGKFCYEIIHGLDEKCEWCIHDKIIKGDRISIEIVSPKDNRIFSISNSPIYHIDGTVSKLAVYRDITDIKNMEKLLQQAQKMEAIGTLAGGIAHDFNNILFGMMGYVELIEMKLPQNSSLKKFINPIRKAGNRAKELIRQILTFSRKTDVNKASVDIVPILQESLKLMRASLPATIRIDKDIMIDNCYILANSTQILQVFINLFSNAGHAMEKKGGVLKVILQETEIEGELGKLYNINNGKYAKISVYDTGYGMSAEVKERIFEPFYTTKSEEKGTGMGLSVVHGIVKSCQGTIIVSSEEEKGSLFEIFFPIIKKSVNLNTKQIKPLYGSGENILLVEDEEILINMVKTLLEQLGYKATAVMNSVDALKIFRSNPQKFSLVLTDQTMPLMTGTELGKEIKKIIPNIPIILMTGYTKLINEEKAKEMGFQKYLMKPFDKNTLGAAIREVL